MTKPAPSAAALTEQEIRAIEIDGLGDTDVHTAPLELVAVIESILAARLADSRPVVSEAAIEAAAEALWGDFVKGEGDYPAFDQYPKKQQDYWRHDARVALTAALPHMSDGRGEAFTDSLEPEIAESWADEEYRNVWLAAAWDEGYEFGYNTGHDDLFDLTPNPYRLSPTGDDR